MKKRLATVRTILSWRLNLRHLPLNLLHINLSTFMLYLLSIQQAEQAC